MRTALSAGLLTVFAAFASTTATAAATITVQEVGSDVVAAASGSLDLGALTQAGSTAVGAMVYVTADRWIYEVGDSGSTDNYIVTFNTAQPLHSAAFGPVAADSNTGAPIGVISNSSLASTPNRVVVPDGYVSGSPINATSTWAGATLASLSLTPGTYVFDYGLDTITFNVVAPGSGPSVEAVPALPLAGLSVLVTGLLVAAGVRLSGRNRY